MRFIEVDVFSRLRHSHCLRLDGKLTVSAMQVLFYFLQSVLPCLIASHRMSSHLISSCPKSFWVVPSCFLSRLVLRREGATKFDRMVPETAKKWFPEMALGFSDSRVSVHITDGIKWVQEAAEETYDAIIVDSSDPVGPAEVLFQKVTYYYRFSNMNIFISILSCVCMSFCGMPSAWMQLLGGVPASFARVSLCCTRLPKGLHRCSSADGSFACYCIQNPRRVC